MVLRCDGLDTSFSSVISGCKYIVEAAKLPMYSNAMSLDFRSHFLFNLYSVSRFRETSASKNTKNGCMCSPMFGHAFGY